MAVTKTKPKTKATPVPSMLGRGEGLNPIDEHVGSRLRLRRTLLGMSQESLGGSVGITFQQLQKYERGVNRISASRLYNLAKVLGVPVTFFFDDLPPDHMIEAWTPTLGAAGDDSETKNRETLELVRAFRRIGETNIRRKAFELIKALSGESDPTPANEA